jgi:hypothetical protein
MSINPNLITLAQAIVQRDSWLAALAALGTAQEYTMTNGNAMRKLVRSDLKEVREQYTFWEARVRDLSPNASRVRWGVPY